MDIERAVVSKIITTGAIEEALSKGLRPEHFADEECREMFIYILDHVRSYKNAPSANAVKMARPKFELFHTTDPLQYLIDQFIITVKRRVAQEMAVELARRADNPDLGENIDLEFLEVARHMTTLVPSTQVSRFSQMEQRIKEYEKMKREGKKVGVPFGFPRLDRATGGIQPHEFVTVTAFSGLGKSTFLMVLAFNAWLQGHTPLIISLEMEAKAMLRKFDAMAAGMDYYKLKHLELEDDQFGNWQETAKKMREKTQDIPIIDSIRGCTPDHVFAETVRHKPDVVILDYISLMRSGRPNSNRTSMWQGLTEITQDLKQNCRTLGVPIVAAAQSNRGSAKDGSELDNVGYSLSVVQDADINIGLFQDEDMKREKEMELRLNKNRDGRLDRVPCKWDHDTLTYREKVPRDMYQRADANSAVT